MTNQKYQPKTEKEQLITERDALKLDLEFNDLSKTERLVVADKIDQLNEEISSKQTNVG